MAPGCCFSNAPTKKIYKHEKINRIKRVMSVNNIDLKKGLTSQQVEQSRQKYGSNILTPPPRESLWHLLVEKFKDPLIEILLVALVLSFGVSAYEIFMGMGMKSLLEPIGILLAVLLATVVGFLVEVNANKKFELLNKVNDEVSVKVMRDGKVRHLLRRELVVGDVVMLETGEEVPADGAKVASRTRFRQRSHLSH